MKTFHLLLKQQRPDLFFYGVVIKTQGYTNPDDATLQRLIQKHGGDYETSLVTHLIAPPPSLCYGRPSRMSTTINEGRDRFVNRHGLSTVSVLENCCRKDSIYSKTIKVKAASLRQKRGFFFRLWSLN
jgi:hypothetical protein